LALIPTDSGDVSLDSTCVTHDLLRSGRAPSICLWPIRQSGARAARGDGERSERQRGAGQFYGVGPKSTGTGPARKPRQATVVTTDVAVPRTSSVSRPVTSLSRVRKELRREALTVGQQLRPLDRA
jgi:hypothetical protein